jgi:hypothetical protein
MYVGGRAGNKPTPAEKAAIAAACERLIAEVLQPRFLPEVRPSAMFNYPVGIQGKWHGNKYRFCTRYRSDDPASLAAEFDAPFARLDYVSRDCFDLIPTRLAVDTPSRGGKAVAHQRSAGSSVCQPFGGLV